MLRKRYLALDDQTRLQISNLLMLEKSPWLGFYFQKADSIFKREIEHQTADWFMDTIFESVTTPIKRHILNPQGAYAFNGKTSTLQPLLPANFSLSTIVQAADGKKKIKEIIHQLRLGSEFEE